MDGWVYKHGIKGMKGLQRGGGEERAERTAWRGEGGSCGRLPGAAWRGKGGSGGRLPGACGKLGCELNYDAVNS